MDATALLSTGIDSPVAAYIMKEKGVELVFAHMSLSEKSSEIARQLAGKIDWKARMYAIPVKDMHESLKKTDSSLHCIICKRMMYRIACKIAEKEGSQAIITGESIGQVASQTLENLGVLDEASALPVLRPLIGYDKEEAIKISRKTGLYEISKQMGGDCPYLPQNPKTRSTIEKLRKEEDKIDVQSIIENAVGNCIVQGGK